MSVVLYESKEKIRCCVAIVSVYSPHMIFSITAIEKRKTHLK